TPANCDGDGTATISGYDSNLTYNLTTGTGTIGGDGSITGDAGNYTITATENGCTSPETSFTIEAQLPTPAAPVVDVTPANCDGDGTATINGYDSNLTYNFTTGTGTIGGDGSITGDAGNYTITATENGCTSTETSFTIEAQLPTPAAPVVDVTSADCDGDGTATISGYDSNLTYNFTTGTGTIGADGSITGVAGNYTITATENGCTSPETSFTIEAQLPNPTISVNPINPSICGDDGALELTFTNVPDGDYTITYNGGTFDVTVTGGTATINTVAGSYQNMVINNGQCDSAPVDASLSDPNSPDDPVLDIGGALCERDGITIITNFGSYGPDVNFVFSPSGPYVDDTDNPGLIMDATIGVTYTVHVEENGCISNSFSFTNAEMLESPVAPQINVTDPTCTANGSAEITNYDTDYTYTFNPNDGIDVDSNGDIINAGFNTTYTVIATNNLGCDSEISSAFVVEEMLPTPTLTVNVTQPANCGDDGSIEVIVTNITDGIYDLTYEDAGGTPHNLPIEIIGGTGNLDLPAGEYNNITINNGDCNSTESINVNIQEPNAPATPAINTISAASCFADEQIEISNYDANVAYTITPSDVGINIDNNGVITGLTPGTLYDLSGVENGCNSGTISISIDEMLETPTITLTSDLAEICEEDSVTLTASGGETYTWDGLTDTSNEITVSPASTTTYEVTGFLSNGCSHTVQLQIVVNPKPDVQTNADHAICEGEETTILAINADSYVWDNGLGSGSTHVVSPTSTTTYEVIGTNAFGCIDTSNVTITVNPAPTIVIDGNLDICTGSSTTLTATGADSYIWDNGLGNGDQHTVSPGSTTTYQVIGIDAIGCKDTVQVTVNIHENPDISAGNNMQICLGDQTMISATGGSTYTWDNGLGSGEAHTVSPTTTTTYEVIGYDNYGCSDSATITITVSDIPEGLPASSYNACQGTNINLTIDGADSTLYTYYWYKDDVFVYSGSSYFIDGVYLTDAGTYNIVIENQTGCTSGTEITLAVNVCDIDIPEVISPNSDGKNDYFYIGNLDAYPNTEIWIYNRWGAEVYHSENYKNNWDGTSQNKLNVGGNELPEGTYYYILKLGGDDNVPNSGEVYTGYIYLKR
ncbi:MAG: gliding motility-associated C-terminal domain-containing protein, partial [Brumimicrobium sp.]